MEDLYHWYQLNKAKLHPVILAAEMSERLVTIHPFIDGNGRVARILATFVLLLGGYDNVASLIGGNVMTPYSEREANLPGDLGNILFSNPLEGPEVSEITSKAAKFPVRQ